MRALAIGRAGTGERVRLPKSIVLSALGALLAVAIVIAACTGALLIRPGEVLAILAHALGAADATAFAPEQRAVFVSIRGPRIVLAAVIGAGLGVSGAVMQGLFRNPLADPSVIGVSAGAALAAAGVIVMGALWMPGLARALGAATLPLAAFGGALAAAMLVYRIASRGRHTSLSMLLLAGIAVNAAVEAGIGTFTYIANDEQLRNLAFWRLGSAGGASWPMLAVVGPAIGCAMLLLLRLAGALNALALGEAEARHLGVDVQRLKRIGIALVALAVGSQVAVSGMILFVGLVAPHMIRLACGPDHRIVLPGAALLGASLLVLADAAARVVVAPAELPIGVLTAAIGAPFFIALLLRERKTWSVAA